MSKQKDSNDSVNNGQGTQQNPAPQKPQVAPVIPVRPQEYEKKSGGDKIIKR